jgi:hypothetical protein
VSTEHIGLARLAEGLELVRVGQPTCGEFAAWRYGATMLRRARSYSWQAVGATGVGLGYLTAMKFGLVSTGLAPVIAFGPVSIQYALRERKIVARVTTGGERALIRGRDARSVRLLTDEGGGPCGPCGFSPGDGASAWKGKTPRSYSVGCSRT